MYMMTSKAPRIFGPTPPMSIKRHCHASVVSENSSSTMASRMTAHVPTQLPNPGIARMARARNVLGVSSVTKATAVGSATVHQTHQLK